MDITIIDELKTLIPPLSDDEYRQLEENCVLYGIREPISVWVSGGENVLIDGHNRYKIACEHNLDYSIEPYEFESLTEVKSWIIRNQIGRRNLTAFQRVELVLALKDELSAEAKERQRGGQGGLLLENSSKARNTRKELAELAGVSENTVQKVERIVGSADSDTLQDLRMGKRSIHEAWVKTKYEAKEKERRAEIERLRGETEKTDLLPGEGLYDVIVIDPPWIYRDTRADAQHLRIRAPYPSMSIQDIMDIKLPMADDCTVFLWTTQYHIQYAFEILNAWGLQYLSTIVWNKQTLGMGKVIRMQCEFCLMAVRGEPILDTSQTVRDIISSPRREHSRKPDAFYDMVNRLCVGRKLDYFAREKRDGWDVFGNDVEHFER